MATKEKRANNGNTTPRWHTAMVLDAKRTLADNYAFRTMRPISTSVNEDVYNEKLMAWDAVGDIHTIMIEIIRGQTPAIYLWEITPLNKLIENIDTD